MEIKPGMKLSSAVTSAQFVVIRGEGDRDLQHGGQPLLQETPTDLTESAPEGEVLIGKRYSDDTGGLELLCVKGGPGQLTENGVALSVKAAKALPASD